MAICFVNTFPMQSNLSDQSVNYVEFVFVSRLIFVCDHMQIALIDFPK